MKIIVMGTGAFAVPTFEKLLHDDRHEVVALVTMPQRGLPGKPPNIGPMQRAAERNNVLVFAPQDVNAREFADFLHLAAAELFFVCDFGRILKPHVLKAARLGGINLHGSLLPRYRGAAPVHWAILNGDPYTGVSVIHMTAEVDAGPVVAKSEPIEIRPQETVLDLEARLAERGAFLVEKTLAQMETGRLLAIPQMPREITKAPKLKKTDGLIDWSKPAESICNHYRAFHPWPGSYTFWHHAGKAPLRIGLGPFAVETDPRDNGLHRPGTVLLADGHTLLVATGQGVVRVEAVHPSGKKAMDAASFMRGHPIRPGDVLGTEIS